VLECETLLDAVQERTTVPKCTVEVIVHHLQLLFNHLDQGRHRKDGRAWAMLLNNLVRLPPEDLAETGLWQSRSSWWPQFHSVPLESKDVRRMRREVFRILQALDVGSDGDFEDV
jgi:predicted SprT family Zn-dependent metalloprotease